jgi:uncharacterized protein (TIGR00299 family) protein
VRVLHFDIIGGISGDMTVAALTSLGAPLQPLHEAFRAMGLSQLQVAVEPVEVNGIGALRLKVEFPREQVHRTLSDILKLLSAAKLPPAAHARAEAIFRRLAEAEGKVHGVPPERVQFHEVGALDSIADIVGCALALEHFQPDQVSSSPALLGRGLTEGGHGVVPLPAPATVELLRGLPSRGVDIEAELTTPTGAAILATQAERFCAWPDGAITSVGYGAGSHLLADRPNLLRAVLIEQSVPLNTEEVLVEANLDTMNPEYFEHIIDCLLEAGALDVWLQPIIMKKSRPAVVLAFLCDAGHCAALERIVLTESSTIGLRRQFVSRHKLARRMVSVITPYGEVRVKVAGEDSAPFSIAPEYEDCRRIAREKHIPLKTVYQAAIGAYQQGNRSGSTRGEKD